MKFDPSRQRDIVIIGGGIVGVATAALLAESGREVLVLDRSGICEETSSGNAAATRLLRHTTDGLQRCYG